MNQRIKELALKSGIAYLSEHTAYFGANDGLTVLPSVDSLEKFAQLLVAECYEHCRGQILDKEVADTNELTYNDAVGDCANGLLQHFGVDE